MRPSYGTPPPPHATRAATVADIVQRLTDTRYDLTAEHALGWGLGDAQLGITAAIDAAVAQGAVERTALRGKPMLRLAGHACDEPCLAATTGPESCTCVCGGANHGSQRATHGPATPAVAARRARSLDRLLTQAPADEDW